METIQMIQKAAAMGSWWLAASSWWCAHSCIMSPEKFFCETSNHPGDSAPFSPDMALWDFWIFLKLKSPLKGKRFQTVDEIQENMMRQLMAIGRTAWGPKCLLWRGLRHPCRMYDVSYILYFLQKMSLFFILHGFIPSGQNSQPFSY